MKLTNHALMVKGVHCWSLTFSTETTCVLGHICDEGQVSNKVRAHTRSLRLTRGNIDSGFC